MKVRKGSSRRWSGRGRVLLVMKDDKPERKVEVSQVGRWQMVEVEVEVN